MSKATITFNLSVPEDKQNFKRHMQADDMASAIFDIIHNSKRKIEDVIDQREDELGEYDVLDMTYSKIAEILEDNNIDIDEIWE